MLSVNNLSASWSAGNVPVLKNISLSVNEGELLCLTGPNGSGKSTLLSLMAGIVPDGLKLDADTSSCITLNGKPLNSFKRKETATHIAYLTQKENFAWGYSVRDIVLSGRFCHTGANCAYTERDYELTEMALDLVKISLLADRNILSLSGGELQKVRIARAVAQEPEVFLMDEPVASLDFTYQDELLGLLKNLAHEKNKAVLVSIHDLNTASRYADKMAVLSKLNVRAVQRVSVAPENISGSQKMSAGPEKAPAPQIHTGTPQDIMTESILNEAYGCRFGTFIHPGYNCVQVFTKNTKIS